MNNILSIKNISKEFETDDGSLLAIDDVSFDINVGEIVAVIGTSGCGKSTLLNIISGLETKSGGEIVFNKKDPRISYMLQNDALLPWRNVLKNATLGLELLNIEDNELVEKVKNYLCEYGLEDFMYKYPDSLSGGMKQRVALIRSLAIDPDILLLDEPFSALDYYTRIAIAEDVLSIIKKNCKTALIITHDIQEAISIADKIVVLSSRPSKVKKIYEVNIPGSTIKEKRQQKEFLELYESIWRDLDDEI